MKERLNPRLEDVGLECVLMQAWKKTSSYLRYHSWYADTLNIDYQTLRIPDFIHEIQDELKNPEKWRPRPLRMVPAPKSQKWEFDGEGNWQPKKETDVKLRPLAHVALRDQVVATAIMMCLADRVETFLGDPRLPIKETEKAKGNRKKILAYGHRLFCDFKDSGENDLLHRWGSTKLYRQYFHDYRVFLERSDVVAGLVARKNPNSEVAVIHSDLSEFYDRVRPSLLNEKLRTFQRKNSLREKRFFDFAERVFNWRWSNSDRQTAADYGKQNVALPQGLVASGFFANVVLSDFDSVLSGKIGKFLDVEKRFLLEDACYYVDDIRLVVRIDKGRMPEGQDIKDYLINWLQELLESNAPDLLINKQKTKITVRGRKKLFLVPQSRAAQRIQNEISGTFDMLHGTELIGAIENFFHTQKRYSTSSDVKKAGQTGLFVGMSDMTDETASRFAAARFRRTFRSLRPLLATSQEAENQYRYMGDDGEVEVDDLEVSSFVLPDQLVLSKEQLDEHARLFAMSLIEEWIANPANVRLLRVAFDMYPDEKFLEKVLDLLRPGWESRRFYRKRRKIYLYCLAELFRAGATETAMVSDEDCLPEDISAEKYHERLEEEAVSIFNDYLREPRPKRHPWYLMQQVMLYLTARKALPEDSETPSKIPSSLKHYFRFSDFLAGDLPKSLEERAIFLVIARTGFGIVDLKRLVNNGKEAGKFLTQVNRISPLVAHQLWEEWRENATGHLIQIARRLGLESEEKNEAESVTVADLANETDNPFCDERNLLALASWLMGLDNEYFKDITPWQILCRWQFSEEEDFGKVDNESFDLDKRAFPTAARLFEAPDWCENEKEQRKFQIGLLLRFAIRGSTALDSSYTALSRPKPLTYNRPFSHWEQQRYSGYQGRVAFGQPWLPLSSFVEDMLFQLLRWPGAGISTKIKDLVQIRREVNERIHIHSLRSANTVSSQLFLEQKSPFPYKFPSKDSSRLLRIGIVQSIIPDTENYRDRCKENDPELKDGSFRMRHRAHIATLLQGVSHMLRVRESHRKRGGPDDIGLDLLVFPELAIHPEDLTTLFLPFIRKHKCIVLCGMVYHKKHKFDPDSELLNSCYWLIPEWTGSNGFQIRSIEQGKRHLPCHESNEVSGLVSFRPVQWLIEYEWGKRYNKPLVLSASVCFDATDLKLAADLMRLSDLYIVCALNKDVSTFDAMSKSMSYHMFQGVILVNNGQYGGSSFFMPYKKQFHRQVFHLHGQPQATISFAEIAPEKLLERPDGYENSSPKGEWKTPPAGWRKL